MTLYKTFLGKILIIGKTNVGKSTLFNTLVNKKISIISKKPNTTENFLMGVHTYKNHQLIFFDTPGIDFNKKKYFSYFNQITSDLKIIIFVIKNIEWDINDEKILNFIKNFKIPIILLFNQIDILKNKNLLLPLMYSLQKKLNFFQLIPVSGLKKYGISNLLQIIYSLLPVHKHKYSKSFITNCSDKFIISEFIREQCMNQLNKELPYSINITVDSIVFNKKNEYIIKSSIITNNHRHKKIIIGKNAEKIKKCSIRAQKNLSIFFEKKIHLYIWVK